MRVLLYGDIDLNLIDGSAIWLTSIAEVLARCGAEVVVLQRTPLTRDVVVRDLRRRPDVRLVDPWGSAGRGPGQALSREARARRRLQPEDAAALMAALQATTDIDLFLVRGVETAALLEERAGIGRRLWVYVTDPRQYAGGEARERLRALYACCAGMLCQTPEALAEIEQAVGARDSGRLVLLPPMIPDVGAADRPVPDPAAPRLGYSGKLSPPYMILETLEAFDRIRARCPGAEFHVIGDKFHNRPAVPGFEEAVRRRLQQTPGVIWHGGVSRAEAAARLDRVDVAISWRAPVFDDSLEMSTKVLEYGALGIPVLMNPSRVQQRVFGTTHRGYVTTADDVVARFTALTADAGEYRLASQAMREVAREFTFDRVAARLAPVLRRPAARRATPPTRVLVAGHDLKFLRPVIGRLQQDRGFELTFDEYAGHVIRDEARSARLLERADIVFCEWCLGNAAWYSRHVRDDQRLVVRLHLQERGLPYLDRIAWPRVDRLIFIAPGVMQECLAQRPGLRPRSTLIYNPIDCGDLDRPKLPEVRFNLGLIGINPKRKRPDLAVDVLERLRRRDSRYTLFVKSQSPWQHDWLWRQADERQYYEAFYERVSRSPDANAIVFDPPGPDVPQWLTKIGWMLSTSDFEGSHQAVAEAMASGAVPAIRDWPGADQIYPGGYGFHDAGQAAALIARLAPEYGRHQADCRQYARERFDVGLVTDRYVRLFDEVRKGGSDANAIATDLGVHAGQELRAVSE